MKRVFSSEFAVLREGRGMNDGANNQIRDRLLEAAEEFFCEKGFEGSSIRDITAAAGCNIASVNYHFGGKERLYVEVWRRHLREMGEVRVSVIEQLISQSGGRPSVEDLLSTFAYAFLGPLVDESRSQQLVKLVVREMLDQHLPANMLVDEMIAPTIASMRNGLARVCPQLEESKVLLVVFSVVGQLIHVVRVKAMFDEIEHAEMPGLDLSEAVNHIVKFSAAGIRAYAEGAAE